MYEIIINQAHGKGAERRWPGRRDAHLSTTAPASLIEQLPPPFLTPPPLLPSLQSVPGNVFQPCRGPKKAMGHRTIDCSLVLPWFAEFFFYFKLHCRNFNVVESSGCYLVLPSFQVDLVNTFVSLEGILI